MSGVQSNKLAPATSNLNDVTTAEFKIALRDAIARMLSFKDDHGLPHNIDAQGLVAVVPPELYIVALEAVSATVIENTSNVLDRKSVV